MKSLRSHFSLITALFSILITLQLFLSLDRVIAAYEQQLGDNYGIVIVSDTNLTLPFFEKIAPAVKSVEPLSPKHVLQQLQQHAGGVGINLMELDLPRFYRLRMAHFITPEDARVLGEKLKRVRSILRVETFAQQHDTVYRLLLLFKSVVIVLAAVLFLVTSLLILKEMRLWQFQHRERMNIMALFGAPVWLRSAVLFRLAIVDAVIASLLAVTAFVLVGHYGWIERLLELVQIQAALFDPLHDVPLLFGVAITLSILLASMIVMGHKEEV
jgi:cell division transport system permease protein